MKISGTILLLFFIGNVAAQTAFESALTAQRAGDTESAIRQYHDILHSGYHSAELYFNLGVAYLETDSLGRAVVNLERAHRLNPGSRKIERTLLDARNREPDALPVLPEFFGKKWLHHISVLFGASVWTILGQLSFGAGLFFLFAPYLRTGFPRRTTLSGALLTFGILLICLGFYRKNLLEDQGVVIASTGLHAAPDATSDELRAVPVGTSYHQTDRIGDWLLVELANGETGWLKAKQTEAF